MTQELEDKIKLLEEKNESLTIKINEVVACLDENEILRKTSIEYIDDTEEEIEEEQEESAE